MNPSTDFPRLLTAFFSQHLMQQREMSAHTVVGYRDTFRLLVKYAQREMHISPCKLQLDHFDTAFLGSFLNHLENQRGNNVRTRNTRLSAIRSFFRYVALNEPQYAALAQRVLAMPSKRHGRPQIAFLEHDEVEALLQAPDTTTRAGRRDFTLLAVATQTGLRASELINLCCGDVRLGQNAHIRCLGKGRKERCIPLRADAKAALRSWLDEVDSKQDTPVFPNQRGSKLSHDGLAYLLDKHVRVARQKCPSLKTKRVTPHTLRHTVAMELLNSGVDCATIALWLGHESVESTYIYLHGSLKLKEQAMAKTTPSGVKSVGRYQPDNNILAFLNSL